MSEAATVQSNVDLAHLERDPASDIRLEVRGLHKSFGATHALRGIDLVLRAGRVHALLGANGCGKSTLVKTLAGYHDPDEGTIKFPGVDGNNAHKGIAFVHQDLGLVPTLSVTENLALWAGFQMKRGAIRWGAEHRRTEALLKEYGIACSAREAVGALGPAEQTMVAIARALVSLPTSGGVLVLDEPTARLPATEANRLLGMLHRLKSRGAAILYISHRLDEVLNLADDVTILRDGACVHHGPIEGIDRGHLVRMIVGHDIDTPDTTARDSRERRKSTLAISQLNGMRLRGVSMEIGEGEIVGIAGLVGSGRSELGRMIFGLQKPESGAIHLGGIDITGIRPAQAVDHGLAYVPQERKSGIFPGLSVAENAILADLSSVMAIGGMSVSADRSRDAARKVVDEFQVKTQGIDIPIETLSGGNQQKISLGKWLRRDIRLLILDEPTQGIDVGARTEIFRIIRDMAMQRNISALVLDSDLEILAGHCDRVLVMAYGRIVSELSGARLNAAALNHAVFGN
jgi:ribose transport system ATP-binding protein